MWMNACALLIWTCKRVHYSNGNERIRCAFVRFCAKGNKAFSAKEFEKAIQHYTAALQFTPRCVCVLCSCLALDGLLFFFFFFFFFLDNLWNQLFLHAVVWFIHVLKFNDKQQFISFYNIFPLKLFGISVMPILSFFQWFLSISIFTLIDNCTRLFWLDFTLIFSITIEPLIHAQFLLSLFLLFFLD